MVFVMFIYIYITSLTPSIKIGHALFTHIVMNLRMAEACLTPLNWRVTFCLVTQREGTLPLPSHALGRDWQSTWRSRGGVGREGRERVREERCWRSRLDGGSPEKMSFKMSFRYFKMGLLFKFCLRSHMLVYYFSDSQEQKIF